MAVSKILVVGDPGRGKTSFAILLSKELGMPLYSTDDVFWEKKFTVPRDRSEMNRLMTQIFSKESWVVEGSSRSLVRFGFDKADIIYHFKFKNILPQIWIIFKRYLSRKDERLIDVLKLIRHTIYRRYKIGTCKGRLSTDEMLAPFKNKVVDVYSFKEAAKILNKQ